MVVQLACGAIQGVDAFRVDLEVDFSRQGMPSFVMVGLAEGAVRESRERVMKALQNSGFRLPPGRITVNLAPADRRKEGSAYDLPLAIGLLAAAGILPAESVKGWFFSAELSLDGRLKPVPGVLPVALLAREEKARGFIVAPDNGAEAAIAEGIDVFAPRTLGEAADFLAGRLSLSPVEPAPMADGEECFFDLAEVKGQERAKRAMEVAAAGAHNLLFIGPPGSGKTMTAGCIAGILPPMSTEESMEVTKIYSVMGMVNEKQPLIRKRPFRNVHHTATRAALIGGGMIPRPGEISLAHQGVLFLDELPEFKKGVLEVLRQPLEQHCIRITRNYGTYTFPADFMLVAAMNPCPCGCYPNLERCTCTPAQIQAYLGKISQPFLDRIDLCVEAGRVDYENLTEQKKGEASAEIRMRVCRVRNLQKERYEGKKIRRNTQLEGELLKKYCALGTKEEAMMRQAFERFSLTARSYHRILRVARTIADLDGREKISEEHLSEALGYRMVDKKYWGR